MLSVKPDYADHLFVVGAKVVKHLLDPASFVIWTKALSAGNFCDDYRLAKGKKKGPLGFIKLGKRTPLPPLKPDVYLPAPEVEYGQSDVVDMLVSWPVKDGILVSPSRCPDPFDIRRNFTTD